jgi:hypothetical protein
MFMLDEIRDYFLGAKKEETKFKYSRQEPILDNEIFKMVQFYDDAKKLQTKRAVLLVTVYNIYDKACKIHTKEKTEEYFKTFFGKEILNHLKIYKPANNISVIEHIKHVLELQDKFVEEELKKS